MPEQHNDFVFTVVGEELGFLGAAVVLGMYGLMVWRIWRVGQLSADPYGALLCARRSWECLRFRYSRTSA
ncbi:MAG: FtsW/RodA/SpoVE family cell cycle protein [Acidimicrobiia bacterium]|nr:FtsW/RodA/SpoVE family cell cycle protein [Acidimicrobiia bacterium]